MTAASIPFRLLLSLCIGAPPRPSDPYVRQPGIDAVHYAFRLSVNDSTDQIEGTASVDIRFAQRGLTSFWLDLASVAAVTAPDGVRSPTGMTVADVTTDGAAVKFDHSGSERLQIVEIETIMRNLQVVMLTNSRCNGAMPLSPSFFCEEC